MSKRNISYIKPEDPSFLKRMKQQIGFDSTTVDTKKNNQFEDINSEDSEDIAEEQPQIVVLKPGDLSSDEFIKEKLRLEKEESEKPADLSEKIIFKTKKSKQYIKEKSTDKKVDCGGSSTKNPIGTKLSFDFDDSDN